MGIIWVGMDAHKKAINVAALFPDEQESARVDAGEQAGSDPAIGEEAGARGGRQGGALLLRSGTVRIRVAAADRGGRPDCEHPARSSPHAGGSAVPQRSLPAPPRPIPKGPHPAAPRSARQHVENCSPRCPCTCAEVRAQVVRNIDAHN